MIVAALDDENEDVSLQMQSLKRLTDAAADVNYGGIFNTVATSFSFRNIQHLVNASLTRKRKAIKHAAGNTVLFETLQRWASNSLEIKEVEQFNQHVFDLIAAFMTQPSDELLGQVRRVLELIVEQSDNRLIQAVAKLDSFIAEMIAQPFLKVVVVDLPSDDQTEEIQRASAAVTKEIESLMLQTTTIKAFTDFDEHAQFYADLMKDEDVQKLAKRLLHIVNNSSRLVTIISLYAAQVKRFMRRGVTATEVVQGYLNPSPYPLEGDKSEVSQRTHRPIR